MTLCIVMQMVSLIKQLTSSGTTAAAARMSLLTVGIQGVTLCACVYVCLCVCLNCLNCGVYERVWMKTVGGVRAFVFVHVC